MSINEESVLAHLDTVNQVAAEYLKGKDENDIARETGLTRYMVRKHIDEWRGMAANSDAVQARAREALAISDRHFTQLIGEAYKLIEDATDSEVDDSISMNQALTHRLASLRFVADLEQRRLDMLHKAGLLENRELAEQLLEQERKQKMVMDVIKDVVGGCSRCRPLVLDKLRNLGDVIIPVKDANES